MNRVQVDIPKKDDKIVDEQCRCGHLKSEHNPLLFGACEGRGSCSLCSCNRFTWVGYIVERD